MATKSSGSRVLSIAAIVMLFFALATSGAFSANNGNGKGHEYEQWENGCHGYGPSDGKNGKSCSEYDDKRGYGHDKDDDWEDDHKNTRGKWHNK